MKHFNQAPFYIFALNTNALPKSEHHFVKTQISETAQQVRGVYAKEEEISYLVSEKTIKDNDIFTTCLEVSGNNGKGQECILYVDNQNIGWLYFKEDNYQKGEHTLMLGSFKEIDSTQINNLVSYTIINDKYYYCS